MGEVITVAAIAAVLVFAGFSMGKSHVRNDAIKAGVACHELKDQKTGQTQFVWRPCLAEPAQREES